MEFSKFFYIVSRVYYASAHTWILFPYSLFIRFLFYNLFQFYFYYLANVCLLRIFFRAIIVCETLLRSITRLVKSKHVVRYFSIYIGIALIVIYINSYTVSWYTFFFVIRILGNNLRCINFYALYHV